MAFSGATDFIPEFNRWLQLVEMDPSVRSILPLAHPDAMPSSATVFAR